jgi:hypothetical protein
MSKIAMTQPYLFPYLSYFQLINSVENFILYDDVQFMQSGWINRNKIIVNGTPTYFNINLRKGSNFTSICERVFSESFEYNINKFTKTLQFAYGKAPNYDQIMSLIYQIFGSGNLNLVDVIEKSIILICKYLDIDTKIFRASELKDNGSNLKSVERVIYLIKAFNANEYINPIGGKSLYKGEDFHKEGIQLYFIDTTFRPYKQFSKEFIPGMSIIDVMMLNSKSEIKEMLNDYKLI